MKSGTQWNKRAQTWSIDLVLGVVIFLLVIVIIYSLIASRPARENQLRDDADRIYAKLSAEGGSSNTPRVVEGNSISQEELTKLYGMDYQTLKNELGIKGDFCIIIVTDQNGIVNTENGSSMGNGKDIVLGGTTYCGE